MEKRLVRIVLAPFFDDYNTGIQYQTYSLDNIKEGENSIEVKLGNGWYKRLDLVLMEKKKILEIDLL